MANFVFYKYRFEHTDERNLFSKETGEGLSDASLNQQFYNDLATKYKNHTSLNLYDIKADRKGVESPEIYANEVL